MRSELIAYFKGLKLKNFGISDELPFNSNVELYLKNPKKVYTGLKQQVSDLLIPILGNHGIFADVHTVSVFFTTDAKNLPSDYEAVVDLLRAGKDVTTNTTYYRREVDTRTSFEADLMVTELEFRFTKLT
jgi:hypothetical protein